MVAGPDGGECCPDRLGGDARDLGLAVEPAQAVLDLLAVERVEAALPHRGHEHGARRRALDCGCERGVMRAAGWACGGIGDLRRGVQASASAAPDHVERRDRLGGLIHEYTLAA